MLGVYRVIVFNRGTSVGAAQGTTAFSPFNYLLQVTRSASIFLPTPTKGGFVAIIRQHVELGLVIETINTFWIIGSP